MVAAGRISGVKNLRPGRLETRLMDEGSPSYSPHHTMIRKPLCSSSAITRSPGELFGAWLPAALAQLGGGVARSSSSLFSPVAIRMTRRLPITSAGRFSPRGPRGISVSTHG
jgi:hypothetical protein